jgi:hypothetical protein
MPYLHRIGVIVLLVSSLVACAGSPGSNVVIKMDPAQFQPPQSDVQKRARIEVVDVRPEIRRERTAMGISMGTVSFEPPETELVKAMLEPRINALLAMTAATSAAPVVYCGIRAFDVETPGTALYWDVRSHVELVIRVGKNDRTVSGTGTERTYTYPSAELIKRATNEALRQAGSQAEAALAELLTAEVH